MASLRSRMRMNVQERREIADAIEETMTSVYLDTLRDLAEGYGYEVGPRGIELAPAVLSEIRATAREHARLITDSYNADVDAFLKRNAGQDEVQILRDFDAWARDRLDSKSESVAITEAYGAYTDATVAFFAENELEPEFEFGGHPELGDEPPECELCQALQETSPHPYSRVLEVGIPHIQCRQNWHPLIEPDALPENLLIGGRTGGVLGADPLNISAGSTKEAVAEVQRLATPSPDG